MKNKINVLIENIKHIIAKDSIIMLNLFIFIQYRT